MSRSTAAIVTIILPLLSGQSRAQLPNGIELPGAWPPRRAELPVDPVAAPWLRTPPEVIPIDVGRQLFVDDFLIAESTLARHFHAAAYHPASPVLRPDRPWEATDTSPWGLLAAPTAMVFSDGVWFDPQDGLFKMWYMSGLCQATAYAESEDGIRWRKPELDVRPGTNLVELTPRDSGTVWLDHTEADPRRRFKMFLWRFTDRNSAGGMFLKASPDGIHWSEVLAESGACGDRTTMFYNPFRDVWVAGLRTYEPGGGQAAARVRSYVEAETAAELLDWSEDEPVLWTRADSRDPRRPGLDVQPQLYNLDAVAYESLLLGLFTIWYGQPEERAKPNEIFVGFSRDGFHWTRPSRQPFIPVSERYGDWNWANVQSAGGGCLIVGDRLFFYVSGRAGVRGEKASGVCSTGLAVLRRDGFASLDTPNYADASASRSGVLTTRPLRFSGAHAFVNVDSSAGELRVELLDAAGDVIGDCSRQRCVPIRADATCQPVRWEGVDSLEDVAGRVVRFRFHLTNGRLYSFWVSPTASGASHGYTAAGGPGFRGPTDTIGGVSRPAEQPLPDRSRDGR